MSGLVGVLPYVGPCRGGALLLGLVGVVPYIGPCRAGALFYELLA